MKMNEFIVASHNENKLREISAVLGPRFDLKSLTEIGYYDEIIESGSSLEQNAKIKTDAIFKVFNTNVISDDSGLEIESLGMAPGVFSARYAGPEKDDKRNIKKVLLDLSNSHNRRAQFRTVISLVLNGKNYLFEGIILGEIAMGVRGSNGFGYDSIFIPEGESLTFAEMTPQAKNRISHRKIALDRLAFFLKN